MTTELDVSVRVRESSAGQGKSMTIAIRGELDIETIPRFTARFGEFFDTDPSHILIDVSDLDFIDMAGLRALATLCTRARRRLITVQLAGVPRQMRALMSFADNAWDFPATGRMAGAAADGGPEQDRRPRPGDAVRGLRPQFSGAGYSAPESQRRAAATGRPPEPA